jgi:hypothetical protein
MHGRDPPSEKRHLPRISRWNFGLIALVMLTALSIATLMIMPEIFTQ